MEEEAEEGEWRGRCGGKKKWEMERKESGEARTGRSEMEEEQEEGRRQIEMEAAGAWGRTEGDSGKKALKWVRGEDDDVEEKERERKGRGRDGESAPGEEKKGWSGAREDNGSSDDSKANNAPNKN